MDVSNQPIQPKGSVTLFAAKRDYKMTQSKSLDVTKLQSLTHKLGGHLLIGRRRGSLKVGVTSQLGCPGLFPVTFAVMCLFLQQMEPLKF